MRSAHQTSPGRCGDAANRGRSRKAMTRNGWIGRIEAESSEPRISPPPQGLWRSHKCGMNPWEKLAANFPRLTKRRLPSMVALLVGFEVGLSRPGARVIGGKCFQHGRRTKNTVFTEIKGASIAAIREQWVIQIDPSANPARSAILFLRDLHDLRSSSALNMLSCHIVEDRARNAHPLRGPPWH